MNLKTRRCQSCKNEFVIEPDDFSFYEKIKVPPPTWCPTCRFRRRLTWRNDWHLFKKKEARSGKEVFSLFPDESPVKIYEKDFWLSDAWDPMEYGKEYDFSRPFLTQLRELLHAVPFPSHSMMNIVDSEFCTNANNLRNCYLVRAATYTEDSAYLIWDYGSKHCFDSHMTDHCELSYGNVNVERCFKTFFSTDCEDSQEMMLCTDCRGCSNCFGSAGLRNKSYHLFNVQYSKEEYHEKLKEFSVSSFQKFNEISVQAHETWLRVPRRFMHGYQNVNVSGDYVVESKNTFDSYRVKKCEDVRWCENILQGTVKDSRDYTNWGDNAELVYECMVCGMGISDIKFCSQIYPNVKAATYSVFCKNGSNLFGCVGLRGKHYCILNKQYSKEEYEEIVPRVIQHMNDMPYIDSAGRVYAYGEFFPPEFSPFPYHISQANEFFPMSREEAIKQGYSWYETKKQTHTISCAAENLPDDIKDANGSILIEVIGCAHKGSCEHECTTAFRVIAAELEFCRRMNIPLPRLCVNCRHGERLRLRNNPHFYKRACQCEPTSPPRDQVFSPPAGGGVRGGGSRYQNQAMHFHANAKCPNEFETSYTPNCPEIVYCEQCYQAEVA